MLREVEGVKGLFDIKKVKVMYYLGYGEKIVYMINLDTNKADWKELKDVRNES